MKIYAKKPGYYVTLLDEEQWEILRDLMRADQVEREDEDGLLDTEEYDAEDWKSQFNDEREHYFCVFDADGTAMGWLTLHTGKKTECAYIYILPAYRGRKLSQLLHEASFRYLIEETNFKSIGLVILSETNFPSINSAVACGYKLFKSSSSGSHYTRDLADRRRQFQPATANTLEMGPPA